MPETKESAVKGTPEPVSKKPSRIITAFPEHQEGKFNFPKGFSLEIEHLKSKNRVLVAGGLNTGIDYKVLRELLKNCQLKISNGVVVPEDEQGKAKFFDGQWSPDQPPPPATSIEEALDRFNKTLKREEIEQIPTEERSLDFPVVEGMEELYEQLKEGKVDAADLNRRTGSFASTREILEANPKVRDDLAEILCRFGDLKYYPHSASYTTHVIPMLAGGVKKEFIMSILEKGADAFPEAWSNILDYFDNQDYRRGKKINRETELNDYKYYTIIEGGFYIAEDPRGLFKKALEENMTNDQRDSIISSIFVRLGYDNSSTLVGDLRSFSQNRLFGLKECIIKAIVNNSKSLEELNKMYPEEFLLNEVPEINVIAKEWRKKGNSDEDILAALQGDLPGDWKTESELERFSKIPIPDKFPGAPAPAPKENPAS